MSVATVDFAGEIYVVKPGERFVIGRDGDLTVDDNPYLHRRFLILTNQESLWLLTNVGNQLTATIADEHGIMQAWLAPSAQIPLIFARSFVFFTAGPTTYEFEILLDSPSFVPSSEPTVGDGTLTIGRVALTADQRLMIVALCESFLRRGTRGAGSVPSSAAAAERLGWALTKFNRKLDNVCDKLTRSGIRGLHGEPGRLATNRRARLIEYALAARIVDVTDLDLLPAVTKRQV
jgi:hypothetical protein